jgi:hypothetical protein
MGLKFRRGTTAQKSGSLAFGEPYVNTDLGTLQIGGNTGDITLGASGTGSQGSFAGISGSSLDITGNAKIDGNLTLGGAITIGDASADTVNVIASLSSSLIPQTTNAFDLGSATKIWRDLYISTGSIKFVEGNTVVKSLSAATLTALETSTGSSNVSITNLNSTTASLNTSVTNINLTTASLNTSVSNLNTATSSYETKGRGVVSGSAQIDGSLLGSNKTITVGSTAITLGGTATTIAGLTSVSSTGFTGALTGNASTATALATARTINGTSFDGSANITIPNLVSGSAQIDGAQLGANKTITIGSTAITLGETRTTIAGLTSVTSTGFTGTLTGNASTATTATTLATARNINGVSFNGSADITVTAAAGTLSGATLASGVTASSLTSVGTLTTLTVSGATATGALTVTGAITATGDITAFFTSDKRHKNNIQTIPNALEKVTKLNGVTWEWNDDVNEVTKSTPKTGLIAQEVQEVLPEVVKTRDDGFLALDYSKMMGLMVEAIKEQQSQIEKLRMDLDNYECKCDNCKSK